MARIARLDSTLIGKIAAGEVIERPASLLKELVENALDAGSKSISVDLEAGGKRLLRVMDDGHGIPAEDLPLAVERHATSKLQDVEQLFALTTLGFRGEALASTAAVSRLRIASRPADCTEGAEISVHGGAQPSPVKPCGLAAGTLIEVRDLFFNVPVRLKFLKTDGHEARLCTQEITRQALCRPEVGFSLRHEGRVMVTCDPARDLIHRIGDLHGRGIAKQLQPLDLESPRPDGPRIHGFVAPQTESRSSASHLFFFVNGRAVRDRLLQRGVRDGFRGLLAPGRHPLAWLFLELDPSEVDANVHPAKAEVRFRRSGEIVPLVIGAVRDALDKVESPGAWAVGLEGGSTPAAAPVPAKPTGDVGALGSWIPTTRGGLTQPLPFETAATKASALTTNGTPSPERETWTTATAAETSDAPVHAYQMHDRYIIEEVSDGIHVIDQHALHEWILFTEIRDRVAKAPVESQRLLFPVDVELGAAEMATFRDSAAALLELGMEISEFGDQVVAVHAVPRFAGKRDPEELCRSILNDIIEDRPLSEARASLDYRLAASLACHSAVRYGMRLNSEEISSLLAQRGGVVRGFSCPHGRPTTIFLSREELDRRFGR